MGVPRMYLQRTGAKSGSMMEQGSGAGVMQRGTAIMAGRERIELSDLASAGAFFRNRRHSLSEHGHLEDISGRQEMHPAAHAPSACMPEPQSQSFEGGGSEQEGGAPLRSKGSLADEDGLQ